MNLAALKQLLKAQPFEPFRLIISSGDKYDVRHPEMLLPLKDRVVIAFDPDRNGTPRGAVNISYLHIAAAEPILSQAKTGNNGNGHSKPRK